MYKPPVDYDADHVHDIVIFLEQYINHESNHEHRDCLTMALAIVREIDRIGKGTQFLSEYGK